MLAVIGTLVLPAMLMRLFFRNARNPLGVYILIGVLLAFVAIGLGLIMNETRHDGYVWLFSWIPPVLINVMEYTRREHFDAVGYSSGTQPDLVPVMTTGIITTSVYFVLLLLCALRKFPAIREVEQEAEGHSAPEP
jgi:hypothetical protein